MTNRPIRRVEELQGVSREHHHTLLLCWKINQGIKKNIEPERIQQYIHWFREEHLKPHFEIEEKWIFPVLGNQHKKVQKALKEHIRLLDLSLNAADHHEMAIFADEMKAHIRFEERDVFQKVQEIATQEQLNLIAENHKEEKFFERTKDEFWL